MSSPTQDTRDRVVALEVKVQHLTDTVTSMDAKVSEMHELLLQARGARWMLMILIALGGFVAAKVTPFLTYFLPTK